MIVLGVDPGGRWTGLALIDTHTNATAGGSLVATPALLSSTTIERTDDGPPTYVPPHYLRAVNAAIVEALASWPVDLIAVERIERPKGFANGKKHTIDPAPLLAAAIVFGAVAGRAWTVDLVAIRAGGNGYALPLNRYPDPLATAGKGHDKRRHERSAYDVACQGPLGARFANTEGYA